MKSHAYRLDELLKSAESTRPENPDNSRGTGRAHPSEQQNHNTSLAHAMPTLSDTPNPKNSMKSTTYIIPVMVHLIPMHPLLQTIQSSAIPTSHPKYASTHSIHVCMHSLPQTLNADENDSDSIGGGGDLFQTAAA